MSSDNHHGEVKATGAYFTLAPEDAAQFSAALDAPPAPTPRALAAAKAYRRRVVQGNDHVCDPLD
ncbi:DUF1778 domain-containing protein [Nisaea sp.]|uniref:type II toxin -antitoxin system TacA 1-like antitoxin n=1 Tax=Nisaea sp. TaxID=2024842 RepID=UPI003298F6C6